jgi:hypothetical protein
MEIKRTLIGFGVCLLALLPPGMNPAFGAARPDSGIWLTLYTEAHQGAFHLLMPKDWRVEGGMLPSGAEWNLVDLVETNIRFRATSPDGQSFFGWYPRFYFQDPAALTRSSGGALQPQPGQVMNGCWLFPFMNVDQYVQHIVFGHLSAHEFQNPRIIGGAIQSPELKVWVPPVASRADYGYVNFECTVRGVPMIGRIYAILYDLHGMLWSTVGTFGWAAPKSRWQQDERLMEMCLRSFRLDPQWARRAAAASRQRAAQYHQVIREMNHIDAEISRNRSQTRSDIQEEAYKLLTGQIEICDPQTGKPKYLPMYNHAWTDGRGNYYLRDHDDGTLPFDNAMEWRKLKVINRNDSNYRPPP